MLIFRGRKSKVNQNLMKEYINNEYIYIINIHIMKISTTEIQAPKNRRTCAHVVNLFVCFLSMSPVTSSITKTGLTPLDPRDFRDNNFC